MNQSPLLERLREDIRRLEMAGDARRSSQAGDARRAPHAGDARRVDIASLDNGGVLDAALPWSGLPRAGAHEVIAADDGAGFGFALGLAARLAGQEGLLAWVSAGRLRNESGSIYPPGLAALGLDPRRVIALAVPRDSTGLWACEECLAAGAGLVVLGEIGRLSPLQARRLQRRAALAGSSLILWRRAADAEAAPAAIALSRWRIAAAAGRGWRAELLFCRGGRPATFSLEWDHASHRFAVAAAPADRSAGAPPARRVG